MTARIEWRTMGKGDDALLFVREYGEAGDTVMKTWAADARSITDFLNDMVALDTAGVPPGNRRRPARSPTMGRTGAFTGAARRRCPGYRSRELLGQDLLLVPLARHRPAPLAPSTQLAAPRALLTASASRKRSCRRTVRPTCAARAGDQVKMA